MERIEGRRERGHPIGAAMKTIFVRIGLGVLALAIAAAVFMVVQIGPRNVWGMLRYDHRREGDLVVGDLAPDVVLTALDGTSVRLHERIGARPVVLIFGSYT
jgi:hypothetical protein